MKKLLLMLVIFTVSVYAFAQSADIITDILESSEATVGQVAYLCAVQQQKVEESASYDDAITALVEAGSLEENASSSDLITVSKAAYLFSKNWKVKGGLLFTITNGSPRYVFKQFVSDGVLSSDSEPSARMSGPEVLNLYTACLSKYSDFDIKAVSMDE